jgi:hypothetical protein
VKGIFARCGFCSALEAKKVLGVEVVDALHIAEKIDTEALLADVVGGEYPRRRPRCVSGSFGDRATFWLDE